MKRISGANVSAVVMQARTHGVASVWRKSNDKQLAAKMTKRIPMKGGDEYDALTKARKFYLWKAGQVKKIKRAYNKRLRKHNKEVNDD
jgi:hypothetical protein